MSEKREPDSPWPGLRDYIVSAVAVNRDLASTGGRIRTFIRWVFDMLTYVLMAAGLYYLGHRTQNW